MAILLKWKETQFSKPFVLGCGHDFVLYNGTGKFNRTLLYVISGWVEGRGQQFQSSSKIFFH